MAEYPALPLFTDAFIADTVHLTAAQTGAYLMLLMVAWRTKDCSLPDNDVLLARYARMDSRAWANNKDVILSFWHKNDAGQWIQKRLLDERIYVAAKRDQAQQAGKASALKRKERHSTGVSTKRQRNGNPHTPPTPTKEPPISPKGGGVLKNGNGGFKVENLLSDDAWMDARSHAPGWDIHHLAGIYNENINSGDMERPRKPNAAFPVWCKRYTKGNAP